MASHLRNLVLVEDNMSIQRCYQEFLKQEKLRVWPTTNSHETLEAIFKIDAPTVVLLDLNLKDGLAILEAVNDIPLQVTVLVIVNNNEEELAKQALKMGASDYLEKPFTRDRLRLSVDNGFKLLQAEKKEPQSNFDFAGFIGSSPEMKSVYQVIEKAADSKASVFITGESGTGKEVCAHAIHSLSARSGNELVVLNCAAIPANLMESEIFGHVKGAFTGASHHREGAASKANGGTLFLDEIGEMDIELQSKLLRFIQTGQFSKVGSNETEAVDVRFICATNRNPLEEIEEGRFREDLYYRLHVVPISLPPLRKRGEDIIRIAQSILKRFSDEESKNFDSFSNGTKNFLLHYRWPGNVRQLVNVIHNIVVLNQGPTVEISMLPKVLAGKQDHNKPITQADSAHQKTQQQDIRTIQTIADIKPLWQVEMTAINSAIEACDGNITQASKLLEINPSTIHRKRQSWNKHLKDDPSL